MPAGSFHVPFPHIDKRHRADVETGPADDVPDGGGDFGGDGDGAYIRLCRVARTA